MSDKIFIGRVDAVMMIGNNGPWEKIKIALGPKDFDKLAANKNEKGWVNLLFKENPNGKKYIEVDTYTPVRKEDFNPTQRGYNQEPPNDLPPPSDNPYEHYR